MCMTMCYVNPDPRPGTYKVILIMNREEFVQRKAEPLSWNSKGILAGWDIKSEGTWLGVDSKGRIGFLTNLLTGYSPKGVSRGQLIVDYLQNSNSEMDNYLGKITSDSLTLYNPFNLFLLEPDHSQPNFPYKVGYCRKGLADHCVKSSSSPVTVQDPFFGIGNHPLECPFLKTKDILSKFKILVNVESESESKLTDDLFELMKDRTARDPDPQARMQGEDRLKDEWYKIISSPYVTSPNYQTVAQTVLLIDFEGNVTMTEETRHSGSIVKESFVAKFDH